MHESVASRMSASAHDFVTIVWPEIADICGGGRLIQNEIRSATTSSTALDTVAGIDAWQMIDSIGQMRGIASRVQWGCNYGTFTIRTSTRYGNRTEFHKRKYALKYRSEGLVYPHLTIQAYVLKRGEGPVLGAAIITTEQLFQAIDDGLSKPGHAPSGENEWIKVRWQDLKAAGYDIKIYDTGKGRPATFTFNGRAA